MKLTRDKYLLPDEYKRLLNFAKIRNHTNSKRDYAILCLLGLCGLRSVELVSVRIGDLYFNNADGKRPLIRVNTAKKRRKGTTVCREDIPVPSKAVRAVNTYLSTHPDPPGRRKPYDRIFKITTRQIRRLFKYYARQIGLNPKYSPHALRHTRGVMVYDETKDIQLVKEALRHTNISITQVYVHAVDIQKIADITVA
jgi:integrase